jgi:hypothetical protein
MSSEPVSSFPFFDLPAELRNHIYMFMLQNDRDPEDDTFPLNEILRRRDIRALPCVKRNWKSYKIALKWGMYSDDGPSQAQRDLVPLDNTPLDVPRRLGEFVPRRPLPPLLDTTVLRVCKQAYREGTSMMYSNKTISLIIQSDTHRLESMQHRFGDYVKLDKIKNLRLEIQLFDLCPRERTTGSAPFSFQNMPHLRNLQVIVTFSIRHTITYSNIVNMERNFKHISGSSGPLEEVVAAVSDLRKEVNVVWGLSDEEMAKWDIGGHTLMTRKALTDFRNAVLSFHKAFPEEKAKAQAKAPPAASVTED